MSEKTWLHWSLTGNPTYIIRDEALTMSEKTWLHWSLLFKNFITLQTLTMSEKTWLHWSYIFILCKMLCNLILPCLKRHGSIEAVVTNGARDIVTVLTMSEKTWLHWSLLGKWIRFSNSVLTMSEKTWLHWSRTARRPCPGSASLTMSEKTWLHWSIIPHETSINCYWLTMSEKTWLHWSLICLGGNILILVYLPCLKRHGSIEASSAPRKRRWPWPSLPCLKRHGSIEATFPLCCLWSPYYLTMSEKTWLHWSPRTTG